MAPLDGTARGPPRTAQQPAPLLSGRARSSFLLSRCGPRARPCTSGRVVWRAGSRGSGHLLWNCLSVYLRRAEPEPGLRGALPARFPHAALALRSVLPGCGTGQAAQRGLGRMSLGHPSHVLWGSSRSGPPWLERGRAMLSSCPGRLCLSCCPNKVLCSTGCCDCAGGKLGVASPSAQAWMPGIKVMGLRIQPWGPPSTLVLGRVGCSAGAASPVL